MEFNKGFIARMGLRAFVIWVWFRVGFERAMGGTIFHEIQSSELLLILATGLAFLFIELAMGGIEMDSKDGDDPE